jgi:hypothetical protein
MRFDLIQLLLKSLSDDILISSSSWSSKEVLIFFLASLSHSASGFIIIIFIFKVKAALRDEIKSIDLLDGSY